MGSRSWLVIAPILLALGAMACDDPGTAGQGDGGSADAVAATDAVRADQAATPDQPPSFPKDPFQGFSRVNSNPDIYRGNSSFGDAKGQLTIWAPPGYQSSKAWPLMVFLHGGMNTTDRNESRGSALDSLRGMVGAGRSDRFIWLAAVIRKSGSYHAWAVKQNTLDLVDAVREVSKRFHIDQRRVYLTGMSMGGGGTASISWVLPRAFAAFGPVSGYYWNNWCPVPDLKGVFYRVVHGALDKYPEEPYDRLKLAEEFIKLSKGKGATVQRVILPGVGHDYPPAQVPLMNDFLLKHQRPVATDWVKVRATVKSF